VVQQGVERGTPVHPPAGKWAIAVGIRVFGFTPVGWRSAAVVAAATTVTAAYVGALVLTRRRAFAVAVAALVLGDGVVFTTGRTALLDGFVAPTVTVALVLALWLRERGWRPGPVRGPKVAIGLLLGLALATKWSAALVVAVVAVAVFDADRRLVPPGPPRRRAFLVSGLAVGVLPVVVYAATAVPFLVQAERTPAGLARCVETDRAPGCDLGVVDRVAAWWDTQLEVLDFHRDLRPTNREAAPGWTWALQTQPTALFDKTCEPAFAAAPPELDDGVCDGAAPGDRAVVTVVGNPVLWAVGTVAAGALAVRAVRRADVTAAILLAAGAVQWLPWVVGGREPYTFYAAPIVPVLAWWLAWLAAGWRRGGTALAVVAVAAVVAFAWLRPVLTAEPLDAGALDRALWWSSWP
jgi:dolichyl-phosphate-mannose--protein O-mannosyl transferase